MGRIMSGPRNLGMKGTVLYVFPVFLKALPGRAAKQRTPQEGPFCFQCFSGLVGARSILSGFVEFKLKDRFSLSLPKCTQLQLSAPCDSSANAKLESPCTKECC